MRGQPRAVGLDEPPVEVGQLAARFLTGVELPPLVDELRLVLVLLDPAQLVLDDRVDRLAQRRRRVLDDPPMLLLKGADRLDVERGGDRLFAREPVEQRAIGDAALAADQRDRRLLVADLEKRREGGIEDALAGVGLGGYREASVTGTGSGVAAARFGTSHSAETPERIAAAAPSR